MDRKVKAVLDLFDEHYPYDDKTFLNYSTDYELLFATILSAQCTDERVNKVTEKLFVKYPSLESFAEADIKEMEKDVRSTGFYRNKASGIVNSARLLLEEYDGKLPSDIDELTKFPGVGRKTANVVRSNIFKIPSVVVDTHVRRVSNRLGFTDEHDPEKIEYVLMEILPKDHWIRYNHQAISHGRQTCRARSPQCEICFLQEECDEFQKGKDKN